MADKPSSKSLELSDFKFSRATVEIRTALNYLVWDRIGAIWTEFITRYPKLKLINGSPAETSFSLENKFTFNISLKANDPTEFTSIGATEFRPSQNLKGLEEHFDGFLHIAKSQLELVEYTRVGLRLIYEKDFPSTDLASDALLATNLLHIPPSPLFGINGKVKYPQYLFKWEDDKKGVMVHLTAADRSIEFNPPPEWEDSEGFKREVSRLTLDFDYYTVASVSVGQFRVNDWLNSALQVIKRDSGKVLRGT